MAFAGLRVIDDLVTGDSDDDAPLGELAAPTVDEGTDSRLPTSESVAADAAAPDSQAEAPQAAQPTDRAADTEFEEAGGEESAQGVAAPTAGEPADQALAAEPTAPADVSQADEDGDTDGNIITGIAIAIVVIGVLGGGIWFLRVRSSRRSHE